MPRLDHRIVLRGVLLRIGYEQVIVDALDAERRIAGLHARIAEPSRHRHRAEAAVEHVDFPCAEIGRIKKWQTRGTYRSVRECEPLIDCACRRVIDYNHRVIRKRQSSFRVSNTGGCE